MTAPARTAAYQALRAIADDRADLPTALARSRQQLSDARDRSLTAEIVTGTLRRQRTLDFLVEQVAGRALAKIDPDILIVLRLSLYQLLHLDRVPASAVVDDAVDLTRAARKPSATGFVNAVLRSVLRQRHRLPLPEAPAPGDDGAAALAYLGVTQSHPDWLVARWLGRYGFASADRWVRFNNEAPPLALRANTLVGARDVLARALEASGVATEPTRYAPDGLIVRTGNPLHRDARGAFVVQDEASQLVTLAVGAAPGERVLDLCASPGGKTTAMASDMHDTGLVVACDVRARRVALLRDTVRASGATHTRLVHVDVHGPLPVAPVFDRVLVDAPCSGLGTIRRDPDIRWRRAAGDLNVFASAQAALLGRAADAVRPGGRLVYATCSSEPEENDAVVDAFLAAHPDYRLLDLRLDAHPALVPLLDERGMMRTVPFLHDLEAFFAAALTRG